MSLLARYLNRLFLVRLAATVFAISLFALLFDMLEVSDDLLAAEGARAAVFGRYVVLRLPTLLTEILPIACLLAALFTITELLRNSELVVMWGGGISVLGVMRRLLPSGLLLMAITFANSDLAVPKSVTALRLWGVGPFDFSSLGLAEHHIWVKDGTTILRLPILEPGSREARDVLIFALDEDGRLIERMEIERALLEPNAWQLFHVARHIVGEARTVEMPWMTWSNTLDLDRLRRVARPPREVPISDLVDIIAHDGYGVTATQSHRTRLFHRVAEAFVPMLMLMLPFALARRFVRGGGAIPIFIKSLALGFSFLVLAGLVLALGEAGLVAPALAALAPTALLGLVVLGLPLAADPAALQPRRPEA